MDSREVVKVLLTTALVAIAAASVGADELLRIPLSKVPNKDFIQRNIVLAQNQVTKSLEKFKRPVYYLHDL